MISSAKSIKNASKRRKLYYGFEAICKRVIVCARNNLTSVIKWDDIIEITLFRTQFHSGQKQ